MTYQHLTVKMFESAKTNGGMVDQTIFSRPHKSMASILRTLSHQSAKHSRVSIYWQVHTSDKVQAND